MVSATTLSVSPLLPTLTTGRSACAFARRKRSCVSVSFMAVIIHDPPHAQQQPLVARAFFRPVRAPGPGRRLAVAGSLQAGGGGQEGAFVAARSGGVRS